MVMAHQEMSGGQGEPMAFVGINGLHWSCDAGSFSIANFDDHKYQTVQHDQVQFTHAAAVICLDQA